MTVTGSTSLALALLAGPSAEGSWCAAVEMPALGLAAAAELGVALDRFALVAPVPAKAWAGVVAALFEAVDVVLAWSPPSVRPTDARRLAARARERGSVLVLATGGADGHAGHAAPAWPLGADLRLSTGRSRWVGLGQGYGRLVGRQVEVVVDGRRAAARERRAWLWLPGPDGAAGRADGPAGVDGRPAMGGDLVAAGAP